MLNDNEVKIKVSTSADNSGLQSAQNELDKLDDSQVKTAKSSSSLSGALGTVAKTAALAAVAAATAGIAMGVKFNSDLEQARTKLMAFTGDGEKVAKTLAWVKDEAAKTQFSFLDMADAAAQLTPTANSTGIALEDLIKQAEVLAALNPSEGLTGAVFSLREALSNDWVSIVERFNLPRNRINQLKDEGVPAMEAISRVLKEMGVDYSLVSMQGQTAAAQFEQVKDRIQMLAGTAAEPLFEHISSALQSLNTFLSENKPAIDAFASSIAEGLSVAIQTVSEAVNQWLELMKPLFDYIGGNTEAVNVLVEGVKIAIQVLTLAAFVIATVVVAAIAAAIRIIDNLIEIFDFLARAIESTINWFRNLPGMIASALSSLANIIMAPFKAAFDFISNIPQKIVNMFSSIGGAIKNAIGGIDLPGPLGKIKDIIPGFATGVRNFGGGLAVVGEQGPELVSLPKGANVYSNSESQSMVSGRGDTKIYQTNNIYNQFDMKAANMELGWMLSH